MTDSVLDSVLPPISAEILPAPYVMTTLPAVTAAVAFGGEMAATLPTVSAAMVGTCDAVLAAGLPMLSVRLEGERVSGMIAVTLPFLTGELMGAATLGATLPAVSAAMVGAGDAVMTADLPALTADIRMQWGAWLAADLPALTAAVTAYCSDIGYIDGTLPPLVMGPVATGGNTGGVGAVATAPGRWDDYVLRHSRF